MDTPATTPAETSPETAAELNEVAGPANELGDPLTLTSGDDDALAIDDVGQLGDATDVIKRPAELVFGKFILDARNISGIRDCVSRCHGVGRKSFVTGFEDAEALFVIDGANAVCVRVEHTALFDLKQFLSRILRPSTDEHRDQARRFRKCADDDAAIAAGLANVVPLRNHLVILDESGTVETIGGLDTGIPVSAIRTAVTDPNPPGEIADAGRSA